MVRIIGNSPERVRISDLGDVIYYKQQKDYTDQEFESSKDLQKFCQQGKIIILKRFDAYRPTASDNVQEPKAGIDIHDLKRAIREVQSEQGGKVREAVQEALPLLVQVVREELSSIKTTGSVTTETSRTEFMDPNFIPDISTEGMRGNINPDIRNTSANDISSNLDALRKLTDKNKT